MIKISEKQRVRSAKFGFGLEGTSVRSAKRRSLLPVVALYLFLSGALNLGAQITSPDMKPVGLREGLRSAITLPKADMGHFDRDSALAVIEQFNRSSEVLRGYAFAQKEIKRADLIKEGSHFTEGAFDVWQYRVTSKGAKSLNFFFSDFFLPEGAFLSIYSTSDPAVLIGPFGADNNNSLRSLSTVPIETDDVVIEVASPRGTQPRMTLEEVNTGLLNLSDGYRSGDYDCSPDVACMPFVSDVSRSLVVIITDGTTIGSGALVNNASEDGTPYILTASHVMNWNFRHMDYDRRASKTVAVFNYRSPICGDGLRPSVRQALSGARMTGVDETTDIALIKMEVAPPVSYQTYYAGWNATGQNAGPFLNVHHPKGQPAKCNQFDGELSYASFPDTSLPFGSGLFYKVWQWTIGTTAPVSSGSPLLDKEKRIIGALTGGSSVCGPVGTDYFSSLAKLWSRIGTSPGARQIAEALTAGKSGIVTLGGRESLGTLGGPRVTRVGHIAFSNDGGKNILSRLRQAPRELFASASEVAERYDLPAGAAIHGAFVVFDVAPSASRGTVAAPLTLTLYNAATGAKISSVPVPTDQITAPAKEESLREIFVPFPSPLALTSATPVLFALNVSGFPSGAVLASQTGAAATAFVRQGTDFQPLTPATAFWVDLMAEDKNLENAPRPFVQIGALGQDYILLSFAPEYADKEGKVRIFSVLGQPVADFTVKGGHLLVPKSAVSGLGVLIFRITLGDRSETLKLLVQK